jgi:hypothetical protein
VQKIIKGSKLLDLETYNKYVGYLRNFYNIPSGDQTKPQTMSRSVIILVVIHSQVYYIEKVKERVVMVLLVERWQFMKVCLI